jgi:Putative transposase DNA-binding domain
MRTVRIYRLTHLSPTLFKRLKAAQMKAVQVWNYCCELHKQARTTRSTWPGQNDLQQATKGRFTLHSQSVQMIAYAFVANIDATRQLRATHPRMCMKRGIRSLKRQRNMRHRQLARKQARCQKYSRRWKKLQRAKNGMAGRIDQRMSQWEYGKDIEYLTHKSTQTCIESFTGLERGTSSQCLVCRHGHKPRDRVWKCQNCGFVGHRDVVGSVNMHRLAYGKQVTFPRAVTYLRPGSETTS